MIIYPQNWQAVGRPIILSEIEQILKQILFEIKCKNLALSGGVDSTTMLALMCKVFARKEIKCFNLALNSEHPDYIYSQRAAEYFGVNLVHWIPNKKLKKKAGDFEGDENVREFFYWVAKNKESRIITCDGIDEFMAGYYDHMKNPNEDTYYSYMRRLQKEQLEPLDKNSGNVKVLLPYIDARVIFLLAQIPLSKKVDFLERKKFFNRLARRVNVPEEIINRHKYGFIDAMRIKESKYEN